jgi:hypothetical protein
MGAGAAGVNEAYRVILGLARWQKLKYLDLGPHYDKMLKRRIYYANNFGT